MRNFRISKLKISALEYISALRNNINFRFVTFFKIYELQMLLLVLMTTKMSQKRTFSMLP